MGLRFGKKIIFTLTLDFEIPVEEADLALYQF
jgi:hypothetical protein